MFRARPLGAVIACVAVGTLLVLAATWFATDRASVFISGVGALAQVAVAVLLYFLTREQLAHAKAEAEYRRGEQRLAKLEHGLADMLRAQVAYSNAKTGMGKTRFDRDQLQRLVDLKDDIRLLFAQPASKDFNKVCEVATAASRLAIGSEPYNQQIRLLEDYQGRVHHELTRQIGAKRAEIGVLLDGLHAPS